jgi:hypothetical protein
VLSALDAGARIETDGIEDPLVRTGLRALLVAVGAAADHGDGDGGGVGLPASVRARVRLVDELLGPGAGEDLSAAAGRREDGGAGGEIGPAAGPPSRRAEVDDDDDDDDDDDGIGPRPDSALPPPTSSSSSVDVRAAGVSASVSASRGLAPPSSSANLPVSFPSASARAADALSDIPASKAGGREGWMLAPPKALADAGMAPEGSRRKGGTSGAARAAAASASHAEADAANSRAATYIQEYNSANRPKSLMELHQEAQKLGGGGGGGGGGSGSGVPAAYRPFDRERDLAIRKPVDTSKIVAKAAGLDLRFSGGSFHK